jgi:GNAT superfamily N-acetyltransferase
VQAPRRARLVEASPDANIVTSIPFSIRPATPADAAAILDCLRSAFEPYRTAYTPAAYRDTVLGADTIADRLSSMSVLVAVVPTGEIIETIASHVTGADSDEGHLRGMAVLPPWQGAGVAASLLAAAESELRERQCARVTLDMTEPLRRAVRFYEQNGYQASGHMRDFFGMPLYEYVKVLT